ncbi:DUF4139 domain-containing protein [Hymenobacter gummosus]|uniref:DUF4139 domain-containing protein n=1 Tax=Hymenobacter gummosus TaxID=1776032 RepID=A0A431TYV2_9BACT|nr:DUF4139 domain-containing protein [Hymenobacter gummosus]RTQ47534.1 DUF4139 domain-containing protein [Hymenobacter gummosus]
MRIRVLLLFLAGSLPGYAQTRQLVEVSPPLKAVTLYLNRSELEHQGSLNLPAGITRVQINDISDYDDGSLEVRLGEGAELMAVGDDDESGVARTLSAANRAAADSLGRNADELLRIGAELKGLEEEKAFLLANRTLSAGTQANWSAEVQRGATLLRTRLVAIQLETYKLQTRESELKAQNAALQPRVRPSRSDLPLLLTVRAARPVTVPLTVRYAFNNSWCWQPQLDIRANESGREVEFVTNAHFRNQSGIPWTRVKLTLINQVMESDVSKPQMAPWTLSFGGEATAGEGRVDQFVVKGSAAGRPVDMTQSSRYDAPEPVTLASGGYRDMLLPSLRLAGQPEYLALPKMTEKVIRQTKISGWEGLQLPDSAQVFYRGSYVGRTTLDGRAYNDSLEVSLGYDERIVVGRAKLEDFNRKSGLSGNRHVRLVYELNVRNLHAEAIRLKVQDQVPVSSEKEIEVKILETSGAELDERTGRLTWNLLMAPNTSQKLRFGFEIEYPSRRNVSIFRRRARISSPKFR